MQPSSIVGDILSSRRSNPGTLRDAVSFISLLRHTGADLATMDHSAMNDTHNEMMTGMASPHSMMMGSMASSPAPSAMHHSHQPMQMSMQMWFQATEHVVLWFREWKVSSRGPYAATIVGLILVCMLQEAISRFRTTVARHYNLGSNIMDAENASAVHPETAYPARIGWLQSSWVVRAVLGLLYAFNLTTSYLLMLAVMSYNVGYFIAIISGLALGHFVFFPAVRKASSMPATHC